MLNRIPFGRTWRIMAYLGLKTEAVAEGGMELMFPEASPVPIASTAIGENKQAISMGIVIGSCLQPPGADRIYGKF